MSDPLSAALALMQARCVISGGFSAAGDWALRSLPQARLKLIGVVHGQCWLATDGTPEQPSRLDEGDVAVVRDQGSVVLSSDPSIEPAAARPLFDQAGERFIRFGDGRPTEIMGGHVELNRIGESVLLAVLPAVSVVRAPSAQARDLEWLLTRLMDEMLAKRPGEAFAASQYSQLLLVEVLRALLSSGQRLPPGLLKACGDERLAPALRLLHAEPGRSWRLTELAAAAAMSRGAFAARFKAVAGDPPMTYLSRWRIHLAEQALAKPDVYIGALAAELGYSSDSAFSNAFKRTTGLSPSGYRRARLVTASATPATTGVR